MPFTLTARLNLEQPHVAGSFQTGRCRGGRFQAKETVNASAEAQGEWAECGRGPAGAKGRS